MPVLAVKHSVAAFVRLDLTVPPESVVVRVYFHLIPDFKLALGSQVFKIGTLRVRLVFAFVLPLVLDFRPLLARVDPNNELV